MIQKDILYMRKPCILACDARCEKAWGLSSRPKIELSDDPDDLVWLGDNELGEAPVDPGTYEGDEAKPRAQHERLNKWCARECERSVIRVRFANDNPIDLPDWSKRVKNIPDPPETATRQESANDG